MLTGLLGSVLDTRFRRRQDLRDARISNKMLEHALAGSYESEAQRAMLEANQGINLLRMAWTTGELGPADEAVGMLRNAMATVPPGSPLDYQLHGRLAAALLGRAQFEPWAQGQATLREAWDAAARAAQQEPPAAQSLVIQMAIAAALADAGPEIQAAGEHAAQRLHEIRASAALGDVPHQLIDMAASMLSVIAATRQGSSLQSVEAALAQLETLSQGADYPGNMRRVLGIQHGRVCGVATTFAGCNPSRQPEISPSPLPRSAAGSRTGCSRVDRTSARSGTCSATACWPRPARARTGGVPVTWASKCCEATLSRCCCSPAPKTPS